MRFRTEQLEFQGDASTYVRTGDTGAKVDFAFCASCGTTLWWQPEKLPGFTMVAMGGFAGYEFPELSYSVYEDRQRSWVQLSGEMEHYD